MPKEQEKKKRVKKSNLFIKVMLGNFLILLLFFGFMLSAWIVHGTSYKSKQYFTPKTADMKGIMPFAGDEFFKNCHYAFFYCKPSQYSSSRNGWYTSCNCYKPNIATYLLSPGLIYAEYRNSGNKDIPERVRIQYWVLQGFYAYLVTGVIIYLFRRKMKK